MKTIIQFSLIVASMLVITACAPSAKELVRQGQMVRMNSDEILIAIRGNSEVWPGRGAGYYQEDGMFKGHWDGDAAEGTWWVENDVRCYDVESWGGEWCHEFYRKAGEIILLRQGTDKILSNRIEKGNRL